MRLIILTLCIPLLFASCVHIEPSHGHGQHGHVYRTSTTYYIDKCGHRIYVDKYGNPAHKRYRHTWNPVTGECYYE